MDKDEKILLDIVCRYPDGIGVNRLWTEVQALMTIGKSTFLDRLHRLEASGLVDRIAVGRRRVKIRPKEWHNDYLEYLGNLDRCCKLVDCYLQRFPSSEEITILVLTLIEGLIYHWISSRSSFNEQTSTIFKEKTFETCSALMEMAVSAYLPFYKQPEGAVNSLTRLIPSSEEVLYREIEALAKWLYKG
jgi:hypothetical protein